LSVSFFDNTAQPAKGGQALQKIVFSAHQFLKIFDKKSSEIAKDAPLVYNRVAFRGSFHLI